MPLNIDSIRAFKPNQNIVFDQKSESLQKAGLGFSFASVFSKKYLIEKNQATLNAIREAVINNPAYNGVKEQAGWLLDQVRKDVKISAAQIQSVLQKLDSLATRDGQRKFLLERFTMRLAASDLPPGWAGQANCLRDYFKRHLEAIIDAAAGSPLRVDVADEINKIAGQLKAISTACTNEKGELDQATFKVMAMFFAKRGAGAVSPDKVDGLVSNIRSALNEARQLQAANPGIDFVTLASRAMNHMEKAVKPGVLTAYHDAATAVLNNDAARNGIRKVCREGVVHLHQALSDIFAAIAGREFPKEADMGDPYASAAAFNFIFREVALSLPRQEQKALFKHLTSDLGRNLRCFYEEASHPAMMNISRVYDAMTEILSERLNRPVSAIDLEDPKPDMRRVPLAVRAQYAGEIYNPDFNAECEIAKFALEKGVNKEHAIRIETVAYDTIAKGHSPSAVFKSLVKGQKQTGG